MKRQDLLDLYFIEARHKLIDVAAFMDRVERAKGAEDFRFQAFRRAVKALDRTRGARAKRVLLTFSDPTSKPIPAATTKAATGAWPGKL